MYDATSLVELDEGARAAMERDFISQYESLLDAADPQQTQTVGDVSESTGEEDEDDDADDSEATEYGGSIADQIEKESGVDLEAEYQGLPNQKELESMDEDASKGEAKLEHQYQAEVANDPPQTKKDVEEAGVVKGEYQGELAKQTHEHFKKTLWPHEESPEEKLVDEQAGKQGDDESSIAEEAELLREKLEQHAKLFDHIEREDVKAAGGTSASKADAAATKAAEDAAAKADAEAAQKKAAEAGEAEYNGGAKGSEDSSDPAKVLEALKARVAQLEAHHQRLSKLEKAVYPAWATSADACPDYWVNKGYDDGRVQCAPPAEGKPGYPKNAKCAMLAKFPHEYDRCGWSKHCRTEWAHYACYPAVHGDHDKGENFVNDAQSVQTIEHLPPEQQGAEAESLVKQLQQDDAAMQQSATSGAVEQLNPEMPNAGAIVGAVEGARAGGEAGERAGRAAGAAAGAVAGHKAGATAAASLASTQ